MYITVTIFFKRCGGHGFKSINLEGVSQKYILNQADRVQSTGQLHMQLQPKTCKKICVTLIQINKPKGLFILINTH